MMAVLLSVSAEPPLLLSVSVCGSAVSPTPVAGNVSDTGVSETPGGAMPMPDSATVCDRNWSVTVSVPDAVPVAVGTNAICSAQVDFAASELPHALVTVNGPLTVALTSVSATSPALLSVSCCAGELVPMVVGEKLSEVVESVSVAGVLPIPLRDAVCVPTLSMMESVPVRAPDNVGVNAMESEQPVCEASEAPHVETLMLKSPVITGVCSVAVAPPVLLTVMICAAAV